MNKQTEWTQNYIKKAYDRITLAIPKGGREAIAERAKSKGMSVRTYICGLILADMGRPTDEWTKRERKPKP